MGQIGQYKELIKDIASMRPDCDIDGLLAKLDSMNFFVAPASSQYNCAYEGGLVEHSLNVYSVMKSLIERFGDGYDVVEEFGSSEMFDRICKYQSDLIDRVNESSYNDVLTTCLNELSLSEDKLLQTMTDYYGICTEDEARAYRAACSRFVNDKPLPNVHRISEASIRIVALLHAVNKASIYEEGIRNEKVYSDEGKKSDELGKFDWVSKKCYKVVDSSNREAIGGNGFSAYYIVSEFIPLTKEETIALVNQYSYNDRYGAEDIPAVLSQHNLAAYLHAADVIATYCLDKRNG